MLLKLLTVIVLIFQEPISFTMKFSCSATYITFAYYNNLNSAAPLPTSTNKNLNHC